MRCAVAKRKISAYLDGALPQEEVTHLLEHLNSCEKCKKEKELLTSILEVVDFDKETEVKAPAYLFSKIQQQIAEQKTVKTYFSLLNLLRLISFENPIVIRVSLVIILIISSLIGNYLGQKIIAEEPELNQEIKTVLAINMLEETPENSFTSAYSGLITINNYKQ